MSTKNDDAEFAGSLRERIRIERRVSDRDAIGSALSQTELVGEYWAAAEAMGNGDDTSADTRSALQRWRFTLRKTDTIFPGDYLTWAGREMTIYTVSEDHRPVAKTILIAEEKR